MTQNTPKVAHHHDAEPPVAGITANDLLAARTLKDGLERVIDRAQADGLSVYVATTAIVSLAKHLGQTPGFNSLYLERCLRAAGIIEDWNGSGGAA